MKHRAITENNILVTGFFVEPHYIITYINHTELLETEIQVIRPETLGLVSDIQDIYQKDIAERDIVKIGWSEINCPYPDETKGTVKFIEGCFYVDTGDKLIKLWQELLTWEIIGREE